MDVPLCLTLGEVAHRSSLERTTLDVFRILNLCQPCDWSLTVSFDGNGPRLLFSLSAEADPLTIVSATPIGIFDYDTITVGRSGQAYAVEWRQQLRETPRSNLLSLREVDGSQYPSCFVEIAGRRSVPSELGEFDKLREFLFSNTWLGSKGIPRERFRFSIAAMGHRWEIRNRWQHLHRAQTTPHLELEYPLGSPALGTLYVTRFADDGQLRYRFSDCGIVSESEMSALGWPLSPSSISATEIEIRFPERTLGPDGTHARDSKLLAVMEHAAHRCSVLAGDPQYEAFEKECRQRARRESAQRIDRRKLDLRNAQFVYWNGTLVYRCPTNENELVSLHQKLEGMGGVPFATFCSLEYTPKLGIDAIVDFKIELTEPIRHLATVEFDYRLENYFNHDHPHEQTDLIVCWDGTANVPVGSIHRDPVRRWLSFLQSGHRMIPVARVKDYPLIDIRSMEGGVR